MINFILNQIIWWYIGKVLGYAIGGIFVAVCVISLGARHAWPWEDRPVVEVPEGVSVSTDGWVSPLRVWAQPNNISKKDCEEWEEVFGGWTWKWQTETCEKYKDLPMGRSVNLSEGTVLTKAEVQSLYPEWNPDATYPY